MQLHIGVEAAHGLAAESLQGANPAIGDSTKGEFENFPWPSFAQDEREVCVIAIIDTAERIIVLGDQQAGGEYGVDCLPRFRRCGQDAADQPRRQWVEFDEAVQRRGRRTPLAG
jgi:hypothetical protein